MESRIRLEDIESFKEIELNDVYDIEVEDNHNYIIAANGGIIAHNSSKTWDFFHFLVLFCDHNRGKGNDIYILRDTLINCRDFTLKEWESCLRVMGIFDANKLKSFPKPFYDLWGNNIYFRGLDDEKNTEGYPSDIIFINEALETEKAQSDGLRMRCRKLFAMDWNPKFTQHWCFKLRNQPNTFFTHSTYENNKHLQRSVIIEIESYEPWESGSYEVKGQEIRYKGQLIDQHNQPPPNKANIQNETTDEFRWKVYGLGLRGAMKGLIFQSVHYIDEFPDIDFIYGNDFGFTADPNAFVKYAEEGNNIYVELLCYHPIETASILNQYYEAIGVDKEKLIIADSSDKYTKEHHGTVEMVKEMRQFDWMMRKVKKKKSVMFWLLSMKEKRIHIVNNNLVKHARIEQENYRMKEIKGISLNQPDDNHNHFWDATRYCHMVYAQSV